MGKYYSPEFMSKRDDLPINGKYYHITDEYDEDTFQEHDEFVEEKFPDNEEFYSEEVSAKNFLKTKTRHMFSF